MVRCDDAQYPEESPVKRHAARIGRRLRIRVPVLAMMVATALTANAAEPYPSRPIRLVNPYAPAGAVDVVCRAIAHSLSESLGQRIIVDNRAGAGGTIGTELVVRAQPDGYTLLCNTSAIAINAGLNRKLNYDALKDLAAVALVSQSPMMLVVHPSVPVRSVRELLDLARTKPGELRFVSSGAGSTTHLALELFKFLGKVDLVHVPYKGGSQSVVDLLAGQLQGSFNTPPTLISHVKSGKLRALAMGSAKRSEFAPELPTIAESGIPGYEASVWYAVFAPRAVPPRIVGLWNTGINRILKAPETRDLLFANGMSVIGGSASEANAYFASETERWGNVIRMVKLTDEQ